MQQVTNTSDPFNFGCSFQLAPVNLPFSPIEHPKTTLVATPVLHSCKGGVQTIDPNVLYMKIQLRSDLHRFKISIYSKNENIGVVSIGYKNETKINGVAKKVISARHEFDDEFQNKILSYFHEEKDKKIIRIMFDSFSLLQVEEVPCCCPFALSFLGILDQISKLIPKG